MSQNEVKPPAEPSNRMAHLLGEQAYGFVVHVYQGFAVCVAVLVVTIALGLIRKAVDAYAGMPEVSLMILWVERCLLVIDGVSLVAWIGDGMIRQFKESRHA